MLATAANYTRASEGHVTVEWAPRSLKQFGMVSIDQLAHEFDLIVIDHPHVGEMARLGCVLPLDELLDASQLAALAHLSPGRSHESYQWDGHQWALAIDAACQTTAWRPDLLPHPPLNWDEVVELARGGRVLWPLGEVDAAASFLTLMAEAGAPCGDQQSHFASRDVARWALGLMSAVAGYSDRRCLTDNPVTALEALALSDRYLYSPLLFCYLYYSRPGNVRAPVQFGDIPSISGTQMPSGALLGGAGLAVSAYTGSPAEAADYSLFVASATTQMGAYFASGGQPAHGLVWRDPVLDTEAGGFFSNVGPVMESSWRRPQEPVFAIFQDRMFAMFEDWYRACATDAGSFLDRLDALYRGSVREHSRLQ